MVRQKRKKGGSVPHKTSIRREAIGEEAKENLVAWPTQRDHPIAGELRREESTMDVGKDIRVSPT